MEPVLLSAALGGGAKALQGGDMGDILKGAVLGGITGGVADKLLFAGQAAAPITEAVASQAAIPSVGLESIGAGIPSVAEGAVATPINLGGEITRSLLPDPTQGAATRALFASPSDVAPSLYDSRISDLLSQASADFSAAAPDGIAALAPQAAAPAVAPQAANAGISSLQPRPISLMDQAVQNPNLRFNTPSLASTPAKQGLAEMWEKLPLSKKVLYGGTGALTLSSMMGGRNKVPGQAPYTGPLSKFRFDPDTYQAATLPSRMARGGIADLGSYSDGGRLLKGPGDGMSDHIPATIANKRPARLADGEFVIPADVVSHLGNGSTDAGAKQLYAMMDRVRKARTGNPKQGKQIRPQKLMVA
jgi:hypothetical protein